MLQLNHPRATLRRPSVSQIPTASGHCLSLNVRRSSRSQREKEPPTAKNGLVRASLLRVRNRRTADKHAQQFSAAIEATTK
ncbi:hypothetical protein NDU88_004101 [Pleurodeles waltl]|uniref:Uncharacterized protein n=1 Tax=Pleurodeles waltl TaxID=8319 RepID=A0AAV7TRM2_PLEWA|nr:hypothetical protein NDU88_004101 [Pleurodeles waltl]